MHLLEMNLVRAPQVTDVILTDNNVRNFSQVMILDAVVLALQTASHRKVL